MLLPAQHPEGSYIDLDDPDVVAIQYDGAIYCTECVKVALASNPGAFKVNGYGPHPMTADDLAGDETCDDCLYRAVSRGEKYVSPWFDTREEHDQAFPGNGE